MARAAERVATEAQEQTALFQWAMMQQGRHPELALMHHIANGGSRHQLEAVNLKRQGVKPGVPDICLPVARNGCHGLYIEIKRLKGGRLSEYQKEWIDALTEQGYQCAVCNGWEAASEIILHYLR